MNPKKTPTPASGLSRTLLAGVDPVKLSEILEEKHFEDPNSPFNQLYQQLVSRCEMSDEFKDPAEAYDALLSLETVFRDHVEDDEIWQAYVAARQGDKHAFRTLLEIAREGWSGTPATTRPAKADKAIAMDVMQ